MRDFHVTVGRKFGYVVLVSCDSFENDGFNLIFRKDGKLICSFIFQDVIDFQEVIYGEEN